MESGSSILKETIEQPDVCQDNLLRIQATTSKNKPPILHLNFCDLIDSDETEIEQVMESLASEETDDVLRELDMACLAARRDFLNLKKFINDRLNEHGDAFAQHLCYYMRRRCPGIATTNPMPSETFQLMFTALQARANHSPMIRNEINHLITQIRSKCTINTGGSSTAAGAGITSGSGGNPFGASSVGTGSGVSGGGGGTGGNAFSLFQNQNDQSMRALRSTPNSLGTPFEFRPSGMHQQQQNVLGSVIGGNSNQMSNLGGNPDQQVGFADDLTSATFSDEIQEEANSFFQQIYSPNGRMSVNDFITKLKNFRSSINPKDRELLLCVVKNLFDEYKFFHEYPERELRTTAEVYGGIIREGIVGNIQFATAIRRVIESLHSEPNSMLWMFGTVALNACRVCLYKYPKVCQMIMQLETYNRFPSVLREYVQAGVQGSLPNTHTSDRDTPSWGQPATIPGMAGGVGAIGSGLRSNSNLTPTPMTPSQLGSNISSGMTGGVGAIGSGTPLTPNQQLGSNINIGNMKFSAPRGLTSGASILNMTNVDTLVNATERDGIRIKQPSQSVFEKVSFICNNLSLSNLVKKTDEMKDIIDESDQDFLEWLAQYVVMKRVTVEQNFQPLYNSFLIAIGNSALDLYVKKEAYRNIAILLRSDKRQAASNFGDRQLLKNLGHWLGLITVCRDEPILARDLDLKYLLLEAFYKGQQELLYVVPFVVKCLLSCAKSTIFGPRCAWVNAILKLLVEIHNEPDLKLNLKFEIEVLCKDLNIDLRSVEVGTLLKESSRLPKLVPIKQDGPSPVPQQFQQTQRPQFLPPTSTPLPIAQTSSTEYSSESLISGLTSGGKDSPALRPPSSTMTQPGQQQKSSQSQPVVIPTYNYNDINIYSQSGLSQHLTVPQHLILFQVQPQLKVLCKTAIIHAIKELIGGIQERSINVALTATEHVCKKDFCTDAEEQHLRRAAHQMMRAMTAGMAAITCREPLSTTILGYLKQALVNHIGNVVPGSEQAKMIEEAAISVTEANVVVATNFIVKSACEKAVSEVEKRLDGEFALRRIARKENNRTFVANPDVVAMSERVPESIRLKSGPVSEPMLKIYDDFSAKICGFKPLSPEDRFIEFARRGQMTTPGAAVNTGTIPLKTPSSFQTFVPAGFTPTEVRPPTSLGSAAGIPPTAQPPPPLPAHTGTGMPGLGGGGLERIMPTRMEQQQDQQYQMHASAIHGGMPTLSGGRKMMTDQGDADQGLQIKVETILREWISICYTPMAQKDPQHALACIVQMMHDNGVLATDEMISKFFKLCADICFDVSYRLLKNDNISQSTVVRQRCYYTLDAFTKLTCLMVKYSDGAHCSTKVNLLKKVLMILTTALAKDHETRRADFNGMPFHRILIIMFNELTAPDPVLDPIHWNILEAFGQALFVLQPRRVPGFAFHWLDIIGHRNFIGRLLFESSEQARTGAMYTQLIICHLKFLAPFLRNVQLPKSIAVIYKGTLRVLLVILHDFPEILCEYHFVLCDVIPANCVQLRNLVLSAYPRDMRLPDPFTQNMEMIESLPEMGQNPKVHRDMTNIIPAELRIRLDDYLASRSSVNFLSDLAGYLLLTPQQQQQPLSSQTGSKYNVNVLNAVVLYVGIRAIESIHEKTQHISMATIAHTAFMDIFQNLAVSLCTEGRYLLFNAIANQLRYPNSHTHYFSCTLLYLFLEANTEIIQEQITRILFERLVALRPHPWGLLITFIELIRNTRYNFWKHDFVRCAPEIERLFLSVANSCSVGSAVPNAVSSSGNDQQPNGVISNPIA